MQNENVKNIYINPPKKAIEHTGRFSHLDDEGKLQFALLNCWYGLPQGAAISPILSSIFQTSWKFAEGLYSVKYADDGVLSTNKSIDIEKQLRDKQKTRSDIGGLKFNWDKSRWIKRDGKWLSDFTFLGTTYRWRTNSLEIPDTENGGIITMPLEKLSVKNIWKFVGRTYNVSEPGSWTWKIHINSYLSYIERFLKKTEIWNKDHHALPFMSTICSSLLLEQSKMRRFDKSFLAELALPGIELSPHVPENLFRQELRGRPLHSTDARARKERKDKGVIRGKYNPIRKTRSDSGVPRGAYNPIRKTRCDIGKPRVKRYYRQTLFDALT